MKTNGNYKIQKMPPPASGFRTFSPVMGATPPLARVAPITATVSQVTWRFHDYMITWLEDYHDYSNCFTSHLKIIMMIVMGTISYDSVVIVIMTSIIVVIASMAPPYCSTDTTGPCSP